MQRRQFLAVSSFAASVGRLRAQNPALKLGYDTYSIRAWGWKAMQHLEFSAKLGLTAIQFSSLNDFESLDPAQLTRVRDFAREKNILVDAGTGCICPTAKSYRKDSGDAVENIIKALRVSHAVGARVMRCFLGATDDRYDGKGIEYHMESTLKVFRGARSVAQDLGVKIALENHSGDMQGWELRQLIEEAGKDYVGACLDTGNPIWCVEHPETALEVLAPYVVTTHWRDTALWEHPRGCAAHWTAMGDGCVDMPRLAALHKRLCPQAAVHLEIITGRPPRIVPYLEPAFWKGFPKSRAEEFARFLALVKQQGRPFLGNMVIEDGAPKRYPEFDAALKRQQMHDLERSLEFAKQKMI